MRKSIAVVAVLAAARLAAADTFEVDKNHSEVSFQIRHLVSKVRGRFTDFQGVFDLDRARPEGSKVEFRIKAGSIDTANNQRDEHLRSKDFFQVTSHPEIVFQATKIEAAGKDSFAVTGEFTLHGVKKTLTLPVTFMGFIKDPSGKERAGFETHATLNRKDFGIVWNRALDAGGALLGDDVEVTINLELKQPEAARN